MGKSNEYDDIPGTTVFDAQRARQGYHLNMFCMSLMKAGNRTEFKANEGAYLDRFPMTGEQKQAVLARDWNRMISLGGNIYYLAKLAGIFVLSVQDIGAQQTGMTVEAFKAGLLAAGK